MKNIQSTRKDFRTRIAQAALIALLIVNITWLNGCMGFSSSGGGPQQSLLSLGSASLSFGSVAAGQSKTLTVTASNAGSVAVTISGASISTKFFSVMGPALPITIAAGQSSTLSVEFTPNTAGAFNATATIASDASNAAATLSLSGTGVADGQVVTNPSNAAFGTVTVGSKHTLSETLQNPGATSVTIQQVGVSGAGFSVSGITAPLTLAAGQSTNFNVSFAPQATGAASGNVTISSNATNPTATIALTGTGAAAVGQLGANPPSVPVGNVQVGGSGTAACTLSATGGSVTVTAASTNNSAFTVNGLSLPATIPAGQSTNLNVVFTPKSSGAASANLTITSNASNASLTVPLSGTGTTAPPGQLGASPGSIALGNVVVGSSGTASGTLTATGGSVTVTAAGTNNPVFSVSGLSFPATIPAGQSAGFSVQFAPNSTGAASANLTITSNASNGSVTIPLSGTGTAPVAGRLTVSPSTLALGNVVVGTSGTASGSLTASGASVTVTGASTNSSAFTITGLSLPVTIPAGQSAAFSVTFSPQATGTAGATLTVSSNAQPATSTETLSGTGTPAPVHSVSLSWNASTSSNVSGYNVYRSVYTNTNCGAFAKINSLLNTSTLYTDNVVADGTSYCYATTAVDTGNQESGYSNIVSNVQIPAP